MKRYHVIMAIVLLFADQLAQGMEKESVISVSQNFICELCKAHGHEYTDAQKKQNVRLLQMIHDGLMQSESSENVLQRMDEKVDPPFQWGACSGEYYPIRLCDQAKIVQEELIRLDQPFDSPLQLAVMLPKKQSHLQHAIITKLLEKGANPQLVFGMHQSPFDTAVKLGLHGIVKLIIPTLKDLQARYNIAGGQGSIGHFLIHHKIEFDVIALYYQQPRAHLFLSNAQFYNDIVQLDFSSILASSHYQFREVHMRKIFDWLLGSSSYAPRIIRLLLPVEYAAAADPDIMSDRLTGHYSCSIEQSDDKTKIVRIMTKIGKIQQENNNAQLVKASPQQQKNLITSATSAVSSYFWGWSK